MRNLILFFSVIVCLVSCQSNTPRNTIEGEWLSVDLVPMADAMITSDDSFGAGLAAAMIAMSAPEHFLFRSDSLYLDGEFKALYKLAEGKLNISFDEKSTSSNVRQSRDTLWLDDFPEEGLTMVFKRP